MINLHDKLNLNSLLVPSDVPEFQRSLFSEFLERVKNRDLITALVGLRRVGKSTLIKQVINHLLKEGYNRKSILYYLFEENTSSEATLREIINYQIKRNPDQKSYIFLDEIQYVDGWNSVLKYYFDTHPNLKFVVSGSSSLFIKTKAKESLAGRIQELVLRPMGYGEYLHMSAKENTQENFLNYLTWGEFPYLEKLPGILEKSEYVNDFVFKKVVENDLPKLKRIYGSQLGNMLEILITHPGQIIEIQNLAQDLGIAQNTAREYLSLLEKTFLTSQIFNLGIGFRSRSTRQRKIYPSSVNAYVLSKTSSFTSESDLGIAIETFVYNHLLRQNLGEVFFFRQRQVKEVDFIYNLPDGKMPNEVKYQNQIRTSDLDNIIYYCKKEKLKKATIITKYDEKVSKVDNIEITFTPASSLLT